MMRKAESREQRAEKNGKISPLPAFCFLLSVSGFGLFPTSCRQSVALPVLFPVPAVTLTTDAGEALNLDELRGKVAIYDFVFTRCAGSCPLMAGSMRALTREIDSAAVRFISISVDPLHDRPAVLKKYASAVRNDDRWIFLTGERQQILDLSIKSFKLAAGDPGPGAEPILHSQKFVVVDQQGMIRGYYDGNAADEIKRLQRDVRALLRT